MSNVRSSAEPFRISIEQHRAQLICGFGNCDFVTFCFYATEQIKKAGKDIQVGSRSYVSFVRREAIEYERYFQLIAFGNLQTIPTFQPACDPLTTIIERRWFESPFENTAEHKRLSCSIKFGNSHLHSSLHRIKSGWRRSPGIDGLSIKTDDRSKWSIKLIKNFRCGLTIIH